MDMKKIPEIKIKAADIKALYQAGYDALAELREEAAAPVVKASFFNKEIIVVYGQEAAKKFYDSENFKRKGAMPEIVLKTLMGQGGVQTLDGAAHRHRKAVFMDLMTPERMEEYHQILDRKLSEALEKQHGHFELFNLSKNVFFEAICEWSGINLGSYSPQEIDELASCQISMISGAAASPVTHLKSRADRKKSELWAQQLIETARKHPVENKENVALYAFANATDLNGERLPLEIAAVDLLNIIRPTVALTVWAALMGHALFSRSDIYEALKEDFDELQDSFIQEMRRYYPFFPMIPAISLKEVEIDGYRIPKDSWVILDLYGTDHDPRSVKEPFTFIVDRYKGRTKEISYEEEYEMLAQGGGDFRKMHRCAGEWITLHSLRVFSNQLVNKHHFIIPEQDWSIPMNRFPTYPNSRVLLYRD